MPRRASNIPASGQTLAAQAQASADEQLSRRAKASLRAALEATETNWIDAFREQTSSRSLRFCWTAKTGKLSLHHC
jgi:hypothetical protein